MKKFGLALSAIALGLSAGAVTYDGKDMTWAKRGLFVVVR